MSTPRDLGITKEDRAKLDAEIEKAQEKDTLEAQVKPKDAREFIAHPIACLFPLLAGDEYAQLVDSIKEHGLRDPLILYEGKILDGRNRFRACMDAGVEPRFRTLSLEINPWDYVWDKNAVRRHLDAGTRGCIWLKFEDGSEQWVKDHQETKEEANAARSESAKEQPRSEHGRFDGSRLTGGATGGEKKGKKAKKHGHEKSAKKAGVSPATLQRAKVMKDTSPDLFEAVCNRKMKLTEALRQYKKRQVANRGVSIPKGPKKYRVLYADPPWKYGDERVGLVGYEATAAAHHYPTMTVAELSALEVERLAEKDAVLFCWATFPLLPDALQVVKAWGFTYKTAFVWDKVRKNYGHYHDAGAELLLICTKGACTPDSKKLESQVQSLPQTGKHSSKPEHFRKLIDKLYPNGNRIELFRRGAAPQGWDVHGNEAEEA